mmetsp:Transcript_51418/g.91797  ORF Transcript_51418/g.91797 Transcript_51418/m.91797 type:complete len:155 (-) Transcript_51418:17-481(-)
MPDVSGLPEPFDPLGNGSVTTGPTVLKVKETFLSLSGNDAAIMDGDGNSMFKVEGKVFSLSGRRKILDPKGNVLGVLTEGFSCWLVCSRRKCHIGTEEESPLITVVKKGPCAFGVDILDKDGKEIGEAKGNWLDKDYDVTLHGVHVCTIRRKLL